MSVSYQVALATRCLWSLQEAAPEIEGMILADSSGFTVTSTLPNSERTQRLAALSATLFILSEHAAASWGRGATDTVQLVLRDGDTYDTLFVTFKPVGRDAVLVVIHTGMAARAREIAVDLQLVTRYLEAVFTGAQDLPPLRWH